jgi:hypothetical protein
VFAGAAREAVFSNPDVIRRVNADFVPVALKAGLVNNPPGDEEGRLYREIVRSKLAPQGICVINSAGKVLDWVVAFDDDKSVVDFLDHCLKRFAKFPDATKPFPAERYMKFPSEKAGDIDDNGKAPVIVERHPEGKHCPARTRVQQGTLLARLFGRALDKEGKPVADTLRQEHYVEDRFHVPVFMQEALAKSFKDAGGRRFRLADDLGRLLVSHAFLGQLDVNPVDAPGGKGDLKLSEFWARKIEGADGDFVRIRIEGKSEAVGGPSDGPRGDQRVDGRVWKHEVKLTWEGIIEMKKDRMYRLLLVARGAEKLEWGNKSWYLKGQGDVTRLMAGHAIDLSCGVRYGIIGEPVPDEETVSATEVDSAKDANQEIPDEARKPLVEALGGPFIVFRDKMLEELKFSDKQKEKLLEQFPDHVRETMKMFEKMKDLKPEEREKEMQSHRRKSHEKLRAFLNETLKPEQLKRLVQLELQQEGPFALGNRPDIVEGLKITDDQRKQFMGVIHEMQKMIEPLIKEAQSGGNPQEIGPRMMKIRKDHEGKIEAILSDAQKKKWKEMLGQPFDLGD